MCYFLRCVSAQMFVPSCFSTTKLGINEERVCSVEISVDICPWIRENAWSYSFVDTISSLYSHLLLFCLTQSPSCLFVLITPPVFSHFKTWNQSFSPRATTLMLLPHFQQFIFQCCFGISVIPLLTCPVIEEWLSVENYYLCSATVQNGVLSTGTSIFLHKENILLNDWWTAVRDLIKYFLKSSNI